MHDFTMPQWAIDRVLQRRSKLHVHDDMDPRRTALIVVDLQNGFLVPAYTPMPVKTAIGTVPNVNRLAAALRETGGKVFWIQNTTNDTSLEEWSNWFAMSRPELVQERIDCFRAGAPGHALYPDLDVRPEDEIVYKYRFSAFIQGSSDLPQRLTDGGFAYVLIVGTVTNVCCESSARDAMMLNFKTIMVSDGNAATNDQEHANALIAFYLNFGDVLTTEEVIKALSVPVVPVRERARASA
jgi:ureidoacrylate peracid hydrolase